MAGVATARRNKDFYRGAVATEARKRNEKSRAPGLFHSLSTEMREALITMAARNFDEDIAADHSDLTAHREARRRKEELARQAGLEK
eukprot:1370569-Pleurochrysis_carterae.AAC.1